MGQKVNPISFRLETGDNSPQWQSSWYANKINFPKFLIQDKKIRDFIQDRLYSAGIVAIRIERSTKSVKIKLIVSRPGLVIGRGGKELETTKKQIQALLKNSKQAIDIQVEEFKNTDLSAKLIAEKIAYQLTKRMPYRRVVTGAMERAVSAGAKGIKIVLSGRINGAEISRREKFSQGTVPLSTLRSQIDYHQCPSLTRSGYIGAKVYLCLA
ncbi:30S ribosomal protein S3 [Patescibacteria group bacterium]|nr:30S ribosomal protein S3 [Patescibacteria group bacterium]